MSIHLKRIYEPATKSDGYRILVDRLWPRGLKKEDAHVDKWPGFLKKYQTELKDSEALEELKAEMQKHKTITLLFAAKDEEHNNAIALSHIIK